MRARQVGGVSPSSAAQLLWVLRGANLAITTDQAFVKQFAGTNWVISHVHAVRKTGAFGVTCAGGIYTAASKAGNAVVAAAQSYAGLTGANTSVLATLGIGTLQVSTSLFLSLTTGNTGALTADVFVFGHVLD